MKTIKERATEYANELLGTDFIGEEWDRDSRQAVKRDFFAGAKAQKEIDINKACDWLKDNIKNYLCTSVRSCGGLNKEVIIDISRDFYYNFKQVMEE